MRTRLPAILEAARTRRPALAFALTILAPAAAAALPASVPAAAVNARSALVERLPAWLLRPGPRQVFWWQWLALPLVFLVAWLLGALSARVARRLLARAAMRTGAQWDDAIVERLPGPLTLAFSLLVAVPLVGALGLPAAAEKAAATLVDTGLFVAFFWALLRSVDILGAVASSSPWATAHPTSRSLLPLAAKSGKVVVAAVGVVAILSQLGYPVASLLAGLGIGGLAVALAGQKTFENLFGSFSIALDQPFREGDFIKVEDFVGTVESVGLRSTRVRTLDRTLITIPNGKLADMRTECFTVRDRIRLACTLGLVYGTTATQIRSVLAGVERVLREHPRIWPDAVIVRFAGLGASSLDVEVMAWFRTQDFGEFQLIRQEVLLGFMDVVERAGSSFAFPTHTVHVVPPEKPGAAP
jgi:MscS family membrane protein